MNRPDEVAFSASVASTGRAGRPSGWRVRLVVGGWVLVLVGVTAVGLAGRDADSRLALAPAVVEQLPVPVTRGSQVDADRVPAEPHPSTARVLASPRRSLGDDGLIGGLPFAHNVPAKVQADVERDGYRRYHLPE